MHILILGAAGMVGRKLTERLLRDGRLGKQDITRMTLQDVVAPAKPANTSIPIQVVASDFADAGAASPLIADRPEVIFISPRSSPARPRLNSTRAIGSISTARDI